MKSVEHHFNIERRHIDEARAYGAGKAENGVCGALFAALSLLDNETDRHVITERFRASAGSTKCGEIRKLKRLKCHDCVDLVAQFMEKYVERNL